MIIKEFLPNPIGKDTEGEYIVLLNDSASMVDLTGWHIKDQSNKIFSLSGYKLDSSQELKLFYSKTKITLNNNGEKLYLYDSKGSLVHELEFSGSAEEGAVFGDLPSGDKELSSVESELLEAQSVMPNSPHLELSNQLLLAIFLNGIILSLICVWVYKRVIKDEKTS